MRVTFEVHGATHAELRDRAREVLEDFVSGGGSWELRHFVARPYSYVWGSRPAITSWVADVEATVR